MSDGGKPSIVPLIYLAVAFGLMFGGQALGITWMAFAGGVLVLLLIIAVIVAVGIILYDRFRSRK